MKQNWSKIAIALGPAIVMVSIVWELARTNPAYNFLVEPWALIGYEMDQGWTYFAVGVVLLLTALAVMPKRTHGEGPGLECPGPLFVLSTQYLVLSTSPSSQSPRDPRPST